MFFVIQVKPKDNLKTGEGEFTVPEKTQPRGKHSAFIVFFC